MTASPSQAPGLSGIWPALLTPLHEDLSIDTARYAAHARSLLAAGCAGVTPFGTTGEGPSFSVDERRRGLDALVAGGVPAERVLVSVSCANIPDTVALTRHAQDLGAWGVLLMPPFFFKGVDDEGTRSALDVVIAATADRPLRVVLYHIPQISGVPLSHAVIGTLLRRWPDRIVAIKDSGCQREPSLALAQAFMPPLGVHVGNEPDLPLLAAAGSRGAVSGIANFMPRMVHRLATTPDPTQTADDLARVESLLARLGGYALIPALKGIMALQTGEPEWLRVRAPLTALTPARLDSLRQALAGLDLDPTQD